MKFKFLEHNCKSNLKIEVFTKMINDLGDSHKIKADK